MLSRWNNAKLFRDLFYEVFKEVTKVIFNRNYKYTVEAAK